MLLLLLLLFIFYPPVPSFILHAPEWHLLFIGSLGDGAMGSASVVLVSVKLWSCFIVALAMV